MNGRASWKRLAVDGGTAHLAMQNSKASSAMALPYSFSGNMSHHQYEFI